MYALLELYARPLRVAEPVICIDETSLQLIARSRQPLPMVQHSPTKQDYEYVRNGTTNLFVAVEPKAGRRIVGHSAAGQSAWQPARNAEERTIECKFTRQDADQKRGRHCVSTLAC